MKRKKQHPLKRIEVKRVMFLAVLECGHMISYEGTAQGFESRKHLRCYKCGERGEV
jgi:hypothetical protein